MEGERLSIEKLSGPENWTTWKFQLEHLLRAKGLWGFITGAEVLADDANPQVTAEFNRRNERAFSTIVLNICTAQLYLVTSCKSAKEAWDTLGDHYERKTLANKLFLKKTYFRCEMSENMSIQEHLKNMKELVDKITAVGAPIAEEDQVVTLLGSLPGSYGTLVTALEARIDDLTLQFVQQALINEEQKRNSIVSGYDSSGTGKVSSAMASRFYHDRPWNQHGHTAPVGDEKKPGFKIKCYKCGNLGHMKRDCPNNKKNTNNKPVHKAKTVKVSNKSSDIGADMEDFAGESGESDTAFVAQQMSVGGTGEWLVDSGASKHMTCRKEILVNYQEFRQPQQVRLGDGRTVEALGAGNVQLKMVFKVSEPKQITMYGVLYVPKLAGNLFSVGAAAEKGNIVQFGHSRCWIRGKKNQLHGMGTRSADQLYQLDCEIVAPERASLAANQNTCIDLWHQRLGHLNEQQLKQLVLKEMATGVKIPKTVNTSFCEGCVEGKIQRKPYKSVGEIRSKRKLQLVYSDVCGPMRTKSIDGCSYFVTFIDDYTRCCKVYFMKHKSEVMDKFKEFESIFTNESGQSVGKLRSDNGGEYVSKEFEAYLLSKGIHHETTVPHTPQQNGVAERKNRTLVETARSMLSHAGLPKMYWAEAVAAAAYVSNRVPTSVIKDKTPYESWYGRKPNLGYLKVFGCMAYAHVPSAERHKLDKKAAKLRFVGYAGGTKGYRLFDEEKRKFVVRRDVVFNETEFGQGVLADHEAKCSDETEVMLQSEEEGTVEQEPQRPVRRRAPPVRFGYDEYADVMTVNPVHHVAYACNVMEPRTMDEAMSSDNARDWKAAADSEYESLLENDTWELVELPEDRKSVQCRWVFKVKYKHDGQIERFKSRLVAKGFSQKYGIDYDETFSPVVRFSSIRALLAIAVQKGMLIHQMDVVTAFLNGKLEQEIYMQQPEGYVKPGEEHLVCKLKKSLYGLKQSPRCWNMEFRNYMASIGFTEATADPCVYVRNTRELSIVAVYVDDLILVSETQEEMIKIKESLFFKFNMKDMGKLHYILGISVIQDVDQNCLWLHQEHYINNMLQKYGMTDANPASTPADVNVKLQKSDNISKDVDPVMYQSMVGSLLYAAIATRPDISQAVGVVSKFNSDPSSAHLTAVKRIFRYLKGTVMLGLRYEKSGNALIGYSDADWAGDLDNRRSTTGNTFMMAGAAISWFSKRQATVALSTAEAEYVALSSAVQEAVWLEKLLSDIKYTRDGPIVIMEDNQGAIAIAQNPVGHARTKHIDIRYHYVRECVCSGTVSLKYCPTDEMMADIFTKPLAKFKFEKLRAGIGLHYRFIYSGANGLKT